MSNEGMPNGNGQSERGPSAAAQFRAMEHRDALAARAEEVNRLGKDLIQVQNQILKLKEGLKKGAEYVLQQGDAVHDLAMELRKKNQEEIGTLGSREEELKQRIQELGGDPEKYTIQ